MKRIATSILLTLPLGAQAPVVAEAHQVLPADLNFGAHLASGDIDGDGLLDHLFAHDVALLGRADGGLTVRKPVFAATPYFLYHRPHLALVDFDGDGDLDACAPTPAFEFGSAVYGGGVQLYANDGTGHFTATALLGSAWIGTGEHAADVAAGDVDGDGDPDLVVAVRPHVYAVSNGLWLPPSWYASGGQNRLWLNQGNGTFVDATNQLSADSDRTTSLALADLDGDGDLDVYVGNARTTSMPWLAHEDRILRNQGNGWFVTDQAFRPGPTDTSGVHTRDFDGDGDVDVLVHETTQVRLRRNTPVAPFAAITVPVPMTPASDMVVGDFDADGFVDFGVCTPTAWQPVRNVGGTFTPIPAANQSLASTGNYRAAPLLADVERDGDLDLLLAPTPTVRARWVRNTGSVPSLVVQADPPEADTRGEALAVGDIDGDGDADVLLAAFTGPGWCYRNDGHGRFTPVAAGDFTQLSTNGDSLQLADFDGDGDLDAAVGTTANGATPDVLLYWNQGGVLTQQALSGPANGQIAAGDLDGDGDVDLYCSPWSGNDVVLTNHGAAVFTVAATALPAGTRTRVPRLADIDADGDLDVVGTAAVLRNGGAGVFTVVTTTGAFGEVVPLIGDFDGDHDVDFVLGASLFRNSGAGAFTAVAAGLPQPPSAGQRGSAAGDFDHDGDLDVVLAFAGPAMPAALFVNDGTGAFTLRPGGADVAPTYATDIDPADLDGDGDLDAVLTTGGPPRIWWNRERHLSWRTLPRVGYPLTLDVEGRANDPFALGLAFAPTLLPIPVLGTLRLDPASSFVLAIGMLDSTGAAVFQQPVPPIPALVGVTLYWQALSGTPLRLGNLERTTFLAQ